MTQEDVTPMIAPELDELDLLRFVLGYLGVSRDHSSLVSLIDALDVASEQWHMPPWLSAVKERAEDELDSRDDL